MALSLNFTINSQNGCSEFLFTDTTGVYNADTNTTGWGAPNPVTGDVDTAILSIENLTTSITYDDISVTPNDETTIYGTDDFNISGINVCYTQIPDGLYEFTYTVTIGDDTYTYRFKKLILCQTYCKVRQLAVEVDPDCGCCNSDCGKDTINFIEAFTLLKALEYSACCASVANINSNFESLQTFLSHLSCKNC